MKLPDNIDFLAYADRMGQQESGLVRTPMHWLEGINEKLTGNDVITGDKLPWQKTHELVRLRPGELTLWAGINGHKKSMLLGQVMAWLGVTRRIAIASLEMPPEVTLSRIAKQVSGSREINEQFIQDFMVWAEPNFVIYDEQDKVLWNRILGFVYYCAVELGCMHIVIDSLTKCGIAAKDGEAEKEFADRLQWAAKTLGCHIHLVCHVRKPPSGGEEYVPTKFDVRGAGELVDLCDNLFIVWKDKKKEQLIEKQHQRALDIKEQEYIDNHPDQLLNCEKQRNGPWEGRIGLWFHHGKLQFMERKSEVMELKLEHYEIYTNGMQSLNPVKGHHGPIPAGAQR